MSRNGQRRPLSEPAKASGGHALGGGRRDGVLGPRRGPRIGQITPAPSDEEAAAIAAAIERFLTETAPPPARPAEERSPWQRAAIREGVEARAGFGFAWESRARG